MTRVSFVGVVAEMKRSRENDFRSDRCCVFGLNEEEYQGLREQKIEVRPRHFEAGTERVVLHCSAWRAMRALGKFGYGIPKGVKPISGLVEGPSGERRMIVWTLIRSMNK